MAAPRLLDEGSTSVAFCYEGTVEARLQARLLAHYCSTLLPRSQRENEALYNKAFQNGSSFTFVQVKEAAIAAPMDWEYLGEDDTGFFRIHGPQGWNPYLRHKTCRTKAYGKSFVLHIFYYGDEAAMDPTRLMEMMIALELVCIRPLFSILLTLIILKNHALRMNLLLKMKLSLALIRLVDSRLEDTSAIDFLGRLPDIIEGIRIATDTAKTEKDAALLWALRHIVMSSARDQEQGVEQAYLLMEKNEEEMKNLYRQHLDAQVVSAV